MCRASFYQRSPPRRSQARLGSCVVVAFFDIEQVVQGDSICTTSFFETYRVNAVTLLHRDWIAWPWQPLWPEPR